MKQLVLLFGNASHAAGATLSAFFEILAAGSWFWGKRSTQCGNPLRTYACLELGATLGALLAGLFMPLWFGFRATCFIATGIMVIVAILAFQVSRSLSASRAVGAGEFGLHFCGDPCGGAVLPCRRTLNQLRICPDEVDAKHGSWGFARP